jgi:hypothetical protein
VRVPFAVQTAFIKIPSKDQEDGVVADDSSVADLGRGVVSNISFPDSASHLISHQPPAALRLAICPTTRRVTQAHMQSLYLSFSQPTTTTTTCHHTPAI